MTRDAGSGSRIAGDNLAAYVSSVVQKLAAVDIDNPQLDARLLICHALGCNRVDLLSQSQRLLTETEIAAIDALIARRIKHEPVARIIGSREFWGLEFSLNEATLEPRPDSETLVQAVIGERRAGNKEQGKNTSILDLGTGTGCLLLALLHELPDAIGIGIDINPRAAEQATLNAKSLGMNDRAKFIVSNWFDGISGQGMQQDSPAPCGRDVFHKFDIIVSNPPYIPASCIPALMPEVRDYDPALALDGGEDGLAAYRFLIPQLKNFLYPNGITAFEVGIGQAQQVADLFRRCKFKYIEIHKDLAGIERCILAKCG